MGGEAPVRVLVVGAGAVGQAFGGALHLSGWDVTWLVKPAHVAGLQAGLRLHLLSVLRGPRTVEVSSPKLVTDPASVEVDLTLWAVPSPVLRTAWLPAFLAAQGHVPAVLLQPGFDEVQRVLSLRPDLSITQGLISLIAYATPLPGEEGRFAAPGTAVWAPSLLPSPLCGPDAESVAGALHAGGLPARAVASLGSTSALGSAATGALMASLEAAGWRFDQLAPRQAAQAIDEALMVVEASSGVSRPAPLWLLGAPTLRIARRVVQSRFLPLDMQTYLKVHFTKVGGQTRQHLDDLLVSAGECGIEVPQLQALRSQLDG